MRVLRKGTQHKQGRLRNMQGILVASEDRAETLSEHLENVQWRVRPSSLVSDATPCLRQPFDVKTSPFTPKGLRLAAARVCIGKACKTGVIPVEVFKALCEEPDDFSSDML